MWLLGRWGAFCGVGGGGCTACTKVQKEWSQVRSLSQALGAKGEDGTVRS